MSEKKSIPVWGWVAMGCGCIVLIGFVVSHTLMILLYYGMFTPIGVVMRLTGWDAMDRKLEPNRESYWQKHEQINDVTRYFKQY